VIKSSLPITPVIVEEVTDPVDIARYRERTERYDRNLAWLKAHAHEVYSQNRGRYICIAGQELFVADSVKAVKALAEAAHPEDDGRYIRYISREKLPRIYANQR
jgi:hypothetical protein